MWPLPNVDVYIRYMWIWSFDYMPLGCLVFIIFLLVKDLDISKATCQLLSSMLSLLTAFTVSMLDHSRLVQNN